MTGLVIALIIVERIAICSNRTFSCNLWSNLVECIYGSDTCEFNHKYHYKGERR